MAKTTRHGGATDKTVAPIVTHPQSVAPGEGEFPPPPTPGATSEYEAFTVEELRAELRGRELSTSGNKAELVGRLEADDATTTEE